MARFSFGIFGAGTDEMIPGLDVKIKDSSGSIVADKSGTALYDVVDNSDGTYYVDSMDSGTYSVYVGSSLQEELHNVMFLNEDVTTHLLDDTKHRIINDSSTASSFLWSGNKISTELATKSATTHNHDSNYSATTHDHEGDYVESAGSGITISTNSSGQKEVAIDLNSADLEVGSSGLGVVQDFSNVSYISEGNSLNQNLNSLDNAISSIDGIESLTTYRSVYSDTRSATATDNAVASAQVVYTMDGQTAFKTKIRFAFRKMTGDKNLSVYFQGKGGGLPGGGSGGGGGS